MTPAELEAASFAASKLSTMLYKASRRAAMLAELYRKPVSPRNERSIVRREAMLKLDVGAALDQAKRLVAWIEKKENRDEDQDQ